MDTILKFDRAVLLAADKIRQQSLSKKMEREYLKHLDEIKLYCEAHSIHKFDLDKAYELCMSKSEEDVKHSRFMHFRKIAFILARYCESGLFEWMIITEEHYPLSKTYRNILRSFGEKLMKELSKGTVRVETGIIKQFLFFLQENGVSSIHDLTMQNVLTFIEQEAPRHAATMQQLIRVVRKFIVYLKDADIVDISPDRFTMKAAISRQKVLPCLSANTLNCVFSSIDTETPKGKRDYAVILLAIRTGMRASDICKLKVSDIDWHNATIRFVQKKTCAAIILPLPTDVGNALADYILHVRVQSDNPYLFQRVNDPHKATPINPSSFNGYLRKYLNAAGFERTGWDGRTFHALRRTAGTAMVTAGTPISTVAQVLGHSNINSSKRYIRLDTENLRICCMGLGSKSTKKEGLM